MPAPPNYVFTIFAFLSFFMCLIRFSIQWHAWNIGIHLYAVWVGLACLSLGINSIIWNHNTVNWAPAWCDISSRLVVGFSVAVPAVILSVNRRLYFLASPTSLLHSEADKRREIMIDLGIGIGLPILGIILFFFVQDYRFVIFEDYGCYPSVLASWIALVVANVPPILLELIAGVYGCLSIHAFFKRRHQMNELLSNHENINSNRYIRLMCFSACDFLTGSPFTIFYLYLTISQGFAPFPGLKQEYYHFSDVLPVPAVLWRATTTSELSLEFNRWIMVWCALVFFAIFGFTEESRRNYRAAGQAIIQVFMMITRIKSHPTGSNLVEELTFKAAPRDLPVDTVNTNLESSVV